MGDQAEAAAFLPVAVVTGHLPLPTTPSVAAVGAVAVWTAAAAADRLQQMAVSCPPACLAVAA